MWHNSLSRRVSCQILKVSTFVAFSLGLIEIILFIFYKFMHHVVTYRNFVDFLYVCRKWHCDCSG